MCAEGTSFVHIINFCIFISNLFTLSKVGIFANGSSVAELLNGWALARKSYSLKFCLSL